MRGAVPVGVRRRVALALSGRGWWHSRGWTAAAQIELLDDAALGVDGIEQVPPHDGGELCAVGREQLLPQPGRRATHRRRRAAQQGGDLVRRAIQRDESSDLPLGRREPGLPVAADRQKPNQVFPQGPRARHTRA